MSSDNKVTIKALRPFEGVEGWKDENSEPFEVSRSRFSELKANGLAEEVGGKAAPEPQNKMAPATDNKAAGDRGGEGQASEADRNADAAADERPAARRSTRAKAD